MRGSKIISVIALVILTIAGVSAGLLFEFGQERTYGQDYGYWYAADLETRQNEIRCAHKGVNSFRIWNREIEFPGFIPMSRPDKPTINGVGRIVHAYPAWHTAFCYFYGWLSFENLRRLMSFAMMLSLCLIFTYTYKYFKGLHSAPVSRTLFVCALLSYSVTHCFYWHNYGILILAGLILMQYCDNKKYQVLQGGLWSLTLVKPQVSILFFWPLFWRKQYKTIISAGIICLSATLITGQICSESPIDLIFQVPQIGAPYLRLNFIENIFVQFFGNWFQYAWMIGCFMLCGMLCYLLRNAREWTFRYLPAILIMPYWTYANPGDLVLMWVFYVVVIGFSVRQSNFISRYLLPCGLIGVVFFKSAWCVAIVWKCFTPSGWGWIYRASEILEIALVCLTLALAVNSRYKNEHD